MANKNTRQLRVRVRKAGKRGEDEIQYDQPVPNYHSKGTGDDFRAKPSSFFIGMTCPTARVRADGLVSSNRKRNSAMRVYVNKGPDNKSQSLTAHEPLLAHEHMIFKNHRQYDKFEYRRVSPVVQQLAA